MVRVRARNRVRVRVRVSVTCFKEVTTVPVEELLVRASLERVGKTQTREDRAEKTEPRRQSREDRAQKTEPRRQSKNKKCKWKSSH